MLGLVGGAPRGDTARRTFISIPSVLQDASFTFARRIRLLYRVTSQSLACFSNIYRTVVAAALISKR